MEKQGAEMGRKQGMVEEQEEEKMKQLTLRIPHGLHVTFKLKCVKEGTTMGKVLTRAIEEYVKTE